jgi:hypothetical protein
MRKRTIYCLSGLSIFLIALMINGTRISSNYGLSAYDLSMNFIPVGLFLFVFPCAIGSVAFKRRVSQRPVTFTETRWDEKSRFGQRSGRSVAKAYTTTETKVEEGIGTIMAFIGVFLLLIPYDSIIVIFQLIGAILLGLGLFGSMSIAFFHLKVYLTRMFWKILP